MRADVTGAGHQIFDEVARAMRRIGIIRLGRFKQRVAHPHPRAADQLLLHQPWIERAAQFIRTVHAYHRDLTGLVVDLDLGDQAGVRVAGGGGHLAGLGVHLR